MSIRMGKILMVLVMAVSVSACGFVMAPVTYGLAGVAQLGVRGADAVIEHNRAMTENEGAAADAANNGRQRNDRGR